MIIGTHLNLIKQLQQHLKASFHMKDLGHLQYFLGLKVQSTLAGTYLHQHRYTQEVITLAGLQEGNSVLTPLEVSQFMQAPRHLHFAAVRCIIRYLKGTSRRGLFFPIRSLILLTGYSDADWAGCADTRRSVTGWCMFIGNALISWKKLGFPQLQPTPLHADNTSAIQITANPVFLERTKHIEVDCYFIREAFDRGVINLPHISTALQIADVFTKALTRHRHQFMIDKLMLFDPPASI
ncbi:hypothetical protein ACOSP7_010359 [Xanthoceras sorbifolium]